LRRAQPAFKANWSPPYLKAGDGQALAFGCTVGVAIAYYLAARVGLALRDHEVAVFWPASGIAVGILVTLGRRARGVVVIGVLVATVIANLMADRSLWTSVFKGFCNGGEAVLTAWLIERWFGRAFAFDNVRHVLGFVAAGGLGAAASGIGGAATMTLLHTTEPFWDVWLTWFLASGVGIVVVAPLMIGLGRLWRELPSPGESIEGLGVLAIVPLASWYAVAHPIGSWLSFDADALVFPLLLWLAGRCQAIFGMAGAFIWSIAVICATAFGVGHFGDATVQLTERVNGAQVAVTMVTLCTLVLTALFTERRRNEAALKLALTTEEESKTRLADAMAAGHVMAFEWDCTTGLSRRDDGAKILGFEQGGMAKAASPNFLDHVHLDDRASLKTRIRGLRPDNPSYAMTFRFHRSDGREVWLEETAKGEFDASGRLLRIKGLTRDVTEHRELEEHRSLLIAELDHRVKNVLSTVSAIASRTQETSSSMADFTAALDGRIRSMATTHELLSCRQWHGLPLAELVHRVLAPYATACNTRIEGSDEILRAEAGQALAMVLHELATNAAKFGALSVKDGQVSVRWGYASGEDAQAPLNVWWEESGGPTVLPQARSGYGTSVIRHLIPYELGGTADLEHAPDGVRCKLDIPPRWLSDRLPAGEGSANPEPSGDREAKSKA
jgi:PAS domain S-box-containing protein